MIEQLSIIIPTLNEEKYLPKLLQSLASQKFNGDLEVIVVDGKSDDDTQEIAMSFEDNLNLRVLTSQKRDVSTQRNMGAEAATYNALLFVDADIVMPPALLQKLCEKVPANRPYFGQVFHRSADAMKLLDWPFLYLVHLLLLLSWAARTPALNGDFVFTDKRTFDMAGGFAEGALLGEDTYFGLVAYHKGARYFFYPWLHLYVSARRVRKTGRFKLLLLWSKAFIYVRKRGPVYPDQGFEYPFGQY